MEDKIPGPLAYLKRELNFNLGEWKALTEAEKQWYKQAAEDEMREIGLLK